MTTRYSLLATRYLLAVLDIKFIRQNPDSVKKATKDKGVDVDVDALLALDEKRRKMLQELEQLRAEQNKASKSVGKVPDNIEALRKLKEDIKAIETDVRVSDEKFRELMYAVPNIPWEDVPIGTSENDNVVARTWGEPPQFDFEPKDHVALGEALGIIDIERASKVAGTRFGYLKGAAALFQFALIQHVLSILTSEKEMAKIAKGVRKDISPKPFIPVIPPVMIRPDVYEKTARLSPQDKDERYYLQQDNMYLIGSAEHTLCSMFADEVLSEADLPMRFVGYSTSFRREAGSYGKDTKGILRVHQFDKLEMESFSVKEDSFSEHLLFVAIQERLMQTLEIPYQVIQKCTADIGNPNARGIDLNSWMPGQNQYRETHTADMMTDYQARRLNTRVRRKDGTVEFAYTNDATAFAIGRTLIAIMENYQTMGGTIRIPKVLQPYMNGLKEIK